MAPKRWQDRLLHFITYFCGQDSLQELEFSCQGDHMPLESRSANISASEPMTPPSQLQYRQLLRESDARKPDTKLSAAATECDDDCRLKILPPGTTQNHNSQCRQLAEIPASVRASASSSGTRSSSSMSPLFWASA
ncbi:hypothetical protein CDV55_102228 [Aspergillus turcosus]|nr:hypothetical protein CDV55_102228 [Aspergillus turcosus]